MADIQVLTREQALSGEHVELPAAVLLHLQRLPESAIVVRHSVSQANDTLATESPKEES